MIKFVSNCRYGSVSEPAGWGEAIAQNVLPGQTTGFVQYDATVASDEFANTVAAGLRLKW